MIAMRWMAAWGEEVLVMAESCAVLDGEGIATKGVECAVIKLFLLIASAADAGQQKTPRLPVRGFANLALLFLLTRRFVPHLWAR